MEIRWTQGPWIVGPFGYVWPSSDVGRDLSGKWTEAVAEPRIIATHSPSLPEAEANNHLIAAAPELYGALYAAASCLREMDTRGSYPAILAAADEALRKARGEAVS